MKEDYEQKNKKQKTRKEKEKKKKMMKKKVTEFRFLCRLFLQGILLVIAELMDENRWVA